MEYSFFAKNNSNSQAAAIANFRYLNTERDLDLRRSPRIQDDVDMSLAVA